MFIMNIIDFGVTSKGEEAILIVINNKKGTEVAISNYGATIVSIFVNDKYGKAIDVVLGYDDVKGYEDGRSFFGACIGRNANRIGDAQYSISGKNYKLTENDNGNNLHSGLDFYANRIWKTESREDSSVTFILKSPDKDQGFPGDADIKVTYSLSEENELKIAYHVVSDADTIVNMTNHSYFNLDGHASGSILKEKVMIDANYYTRTDSKSIPTGELVDVTGTPMDFRTFKEIGQDINCDYETLKNADGYDHNYVLNNNGQLCKVAAIKSDVSGITMEIMTDMPGLQLYTGNFINHNAGKSGALYNAKDAVCFETQYFPDAPHHDDFLSSILKAGEIYDKTTIYKFCIS